MRQQQAQLDSVTVARGLYLAALLGVLLVASGCGRTEIRESYGRLRRVHDGSAIAGTSVLGQLFESRGCKTLKSRTFLSPSASRFDTIVWVPNSFKPPNIEAREFLHSWLAEKPGRTLIYVGRDWDANSFYWKTLLKTAPEEEKAAIQRKLAFSQSAFDESRTQIQNNGYGHWFTVETRHGIEVVNGFDGPWAAGLDGSKSEITLNSRWRPPTNRELDEYELLLQTEPLLTTDKGDWLVTKLTDEFDFGGSKIILVANGSMLLNAGLVNEENRKIAGRILDECNLPSDVMFLETTDRVFVRDPSDRLTGDEMLRTEPIWPLANHLMFLGIIWWFVHYPIFGRARQRVRRDELENSDEAWLMDEDKVDFGKHIDALATLYRKGGQREYARNAYEQYQRLIHRDTKN